MLTIGAIGILVGLHAFFVAAEFALVGARTRTSQLQTLADAGDRRARLALRMLERLDDTISGTQVGISLTSLGLGWVGAVWLAPSLHGFFRLLPAPLLVIFTHVTAGIVTFFGLVFLHVIFGVMVPKSVAQVQPEHLSRLVAQPLMLFHTVCWPVSRVMHTSATRILALFNIRTPSPVERAHAPEDLLFLLEESHEQGLVEESDAEMIAGVLDLSRTSVREAMTPRTEICAVERGWSLEKIIDVVQTEGFSRLPVYEGDLDHIVGILLAKDLLAFFDGKTPFSADSVMREPVFTFATMQVDDLMQELQQRNAHMAIVNDEYGGTLGLITLEDLIEGIVGEIFDEFDDTDDDTTVQATADGHLSIPGDLPIEEFNERYALHLSAGDYVTVAGLVLSALGHVPSVGQYAKVDGVTFNVTAMDRQRIERLEVILPDSKKEGPFSSASDAPA